MHKKNVSVRLSRRQMVVLGGAMLVNPSAAGSVLTAPAPTIGPSPQNLRCEYRENPLGIDVLQPRLSWTMTGTQRGERQTAYQVLVASSPEMLASGRGDLWDSGRVKTDRSSAVVYAGKALASRAQCYWKVRIWDRAGKPTDWSATARWSVGLLHLTDWQGDWIADPILAAPANRPRTPIHCYRSQSASTPDTTKWIVLDLGAPTAIEGACLKPAKPDGINGDIATILYPVRFKIEATNAPDFSDATVVIDKTGQDVAPPRPGFTDPERYNFPRRTARYVRLTVNRLSWWEGNEYALALGRFQVFYGNTDIAVNAHATASDSVETAEWSVRFLTHPKAKIAYNPTPAVLQPHLGGVDFPSRVPMLRREFTTKGKIRRATLYCSARGFYEARLNGKRVSEDLLAPGYTEYDRRLEYQVYEVTDLLKEGPNAFGALLGYGWYAGHMNINNNEYLYGYFPQLLAQLEIHYADGRRDTIVGDTHWKSTLDGPVRWSDLLDGEGYDCRKEMPGWDQPQFDDSAWKPVALIHRDKTPIVWQRAQPVRRMEELIPISKKQVAPGVAVFDLGQEIAGRCRFKADGPAGARLTLRHAELRHPDGNINRDNLWGTPAQGDYILDGHGARILESHFTYHGFRFVEVAGLTETTTVDALTGIHLRTDARQVGHFTCSNALYNKLMTASRWTQQNMMFDLPTGCAGRGERLAWTGDIRPCVQTALFHFDIAAFFEKYAADLRTSQKEDGRFTDICPHAHLRNTDVCVGSPGWADAGVSLPWELYLNTGDVRILAEHYLAACRWVDHIHRNNPDLIWTKARGMNWGDWLSAGKATPSDIGSTAFFAHSADLVSRMADVLGHKEDATRYRTLFLHIRSAFAKRFVTQEGIIASPRQVRDVTEIVRGLVKDKQLKLTVTNDALGGDPAPNTPKQLMITYRVVDKRITREFAENTLVDLNPGGLSFEIIHAEYGESAGDLLAKDAQGSYALALQFGLLDEPFRTRAAGRLVQVILRDGGHPATGFWSSIELLLALSDNGQHEVATRMANLTTAPSWGHIVQGDGTTFWESFTADRANLSLNHWTHSAIGEWLWRHIAGIAPDPDHPGYQSVIIRPRPTAEVDWCKAEYESLRGPIAVNWNRSDKEFTLEVTIPANMVATVYLPATEGAKITEGDRAATNAPGVQLLRRESTNAIYRIESGQYRFAVRG